MALSGANRAPSTVAKSAHSSLWEEQRKPGSPAALRKLSGWAEHKSRPPAGGALTPEKRGAPGFFGFQRRHYEPARPGYLFGQRPIMARRRPYEFAARLTGVLSPAVSSSTPNRYRIIPCPTLSHGPDGAGGWCSRQHLRTVGRHGLPIGRSDARLILPTRRTICPQKSHPQMKGWFVQQAHRALGPGNIIVGSDRLKDWETAG